MQLPTVIHKAMTLGIIWVPLLYYAPPPLMLASWLVTLYNDHSIRLCLREDEDMSAVADMIAGQARAMICLSIALLIPTFVIGLMIVVTKNDSYFAIAGGAGMIAAFIDTARLAFLPKEKMQSFIRKMVTAQNKLK